MINFGRFRKFRVSLGPVEQVQIVISTAVVVTLATIVVVRWTSGHTLEWLLFGSVLSVGIFGFIIVAVTLKYGRLLEEQKQELLALNSFSESINRAVNIQFLLQNALNEVRRLLDIEYGWIYRMDGHRLILAAQRGTEELNTSILDPSIDLTDERFDWVQKARIAKRQDKARGGQTLTWEYGVVGSWASVPILMKEQFSGVIIAASKNREAFTNKQVDLMAAFANQLGVAMENATLFDRLRKSEEQYIDLFEHSPDMSHIINRDGIIISCNQTEANLLGYSKEELIGKPFSILYPSEYHEEARKMLDEIFDHHHEMNGLEEKMITRRGDSIDVSVNTSIIQDEDGNLTLMRAVARDITEKKKLEAKIMHAQRIDSIGNLAGGIAHDFNNILTSILGSTAIMHRKMKRDSEGFRFVEIIDTAAKRGASLTRQLLTFARKSTVHFRPIIVNDIIQETLHLFERSTDKTITIQTSTFDQTLLINGDDGQIQQALLNLLINARDAMPTGGTISIKTNKLVLNESDLSQPEERKGEFVTISISDTGIGMTRQILAHIFEPFFTTKDQGKGTGLGLSVVYGVINTHNGFITVHSQPNVGTEFIVHLPMHPLTESFKKPMHSMKLTRGKEHILVVDDEKNVAKVISGMLEDLGYKVTIAYNGKRAISLYKKNKRFDAVILDLNMPKISGQETFLKLKELDQNIHVIIATGYSNRIIDSSPLRNSVDALLQKPFQIEELSKTLRLVFDGVKA